MAGKPLIAYSIEAALQCSYISRCIVSTEDGAIKQVSLQYGAEVFDRPVQLAADDSLSQDVVKDVLSRLGKLPEYFVLLQPTSPLRTAAHLEQCIEQFSEKYKSAISVTECEHHPYKSFLLENGLLTPLVNKNFLDQPRQALPGAVRQNGAIYLENTREFLAQGSFFIEPSMPYLMDKESGIDIDTPGDFLTAEACLQK